MRILLIVFGAIVVVLGVVLAGFAVRPAPFRLTEEPVDRGGSTLATGLPAPVARFAEEISLEGLPRADSAVVVGTGWMRLGPVKAPLRFRGEYRPAKEYWRAIDVAWMGVSVMRGLDTWMGGVGKMTVFGKTWAGRDMDQGANMASFAEALWMPSVLLTDPRVRWEPIDDTHARLVFPSGDGTDSMEYTFDPKTGRPMSAVAMRFKAGEDHKTEWITRTLEWGHVRGRLTPVKVDVRWGDAKEPWAMFEIRDVVLNAPVPQLERS